MKDGIVVCSVILQIVGTLLFMYGFFPQRIVIQNETINEGFNVTDVIDGEPDRLVFMIIDAFSYDFISNPVYSKDMPFLQKSIKVNNEAMLFRAHVQSPTVTLPRIKALVSGTIPAYMDVIFNFGAGEFIEDNWLKRAREAGYRILFYGDDTWFSMFTKDMFLDRSEGTSSFFVKDYTEVDTNITRYLDREFKSEASWDILMLHYLGLDHIGHSLGGKHPQVHTKLNEMDTVIEGIWTNLSRSTHDNETVCFILLGDHGMTIAGGHGGSSDRESYVPLFIWNSDPMQQKRSEIINVEQVDLVPTISFLLNLDIPTKSVGISLDEYFLSDLNEIVKRMEVNAQQLYQLALSNRPLFNVNELDELKMCTSVRLDKEAFISKCRQILKRVQKKFLFSNENLNYPFIIIGILISLLATTILLFNMLKERQISMGFLVLIQPFSLFSSSFIEEEHDLWYYLFATYICVEVLKACLKRGYIGLEGVDRTMLYDLLVLLISNRIARYPYEINRWCIGVVLLLIFNYPFRSLFNKKATLSNIVFVISSIIILAVKFSFIGNSIITHLLIVITFIICGWSKGFIVWQLLILNPTNYQIALLCQLIGYKLGILSVSVKFDHSFMLYAALSATFFYTGASNTLDTIDIAPGYVGLSDFIFLIVGLQMSLNAYMGIVNLIIGWNLAQNTSTKSPIKQILMDIFAIRSLVLFFTMLNLFHQRSHLFNWSVFTPKLLLEGLHYLNVAVWALVEYCVYLYGYINNMYVNKRKSNKLL